MKEKSTAVIVQQTERKINMHMNHKQKIRFFQLAQLAIMKMPMADFMELTGTAVGNVAQEKIKMICKCQNEIETETSLLAYEKEETV